MSLYRLCATPGLVLNTETFLSVPDSDADYQAWLAEGNEPDPFVPPPPAGELADAILFDHENRLRQLEGQPPMTLEDFRKR